MSKINRFSSPVCWLANSRTCAEEPGQELLWPDQITSLPYWFIGASDIQRKKGRFSFTSSSWRRRLDSFWNKAQLLFSLRDTDLSSGGYWSFTTKLKNKQTKRNFAKNILIKKWWVFVFHQCWVSFQKPGLCNFTRNYPADFKIPTPPS